MISNPPHCRKLTENLRQGLRTTKIHSAMSVTPRLIQFSSWVGIQDWADPHWVEVNNRKREKGNCQVTACLNQIMLVIYYKVQTPKAASHLGAVRWSGPLLPCIPNPAIPPLLSCTPNPAIPLQSSVSPSSKAFSLCLFIEMSSEEYVFICHLN